MDNNKNTEFNYTYSAKEQAELKKIREKYITKNKSEELSKMEQIKRLDARVSSTATAFSLALGIMSTLIMGFGMSLIMTDLKEILGSHTNLSLIIGIVIGVVGMAGVIAAYPLYQKIIESERRKIAPEILRLTDELMENK